MGEGDLVFIIIVISAIIAVIAMLVLNIVLLVQNGNLRKEIRSGRQETLSFMQKQMTDMAWLNEQKLDNIRATMEFRLSSMQDDNNDQLSKMREVVDEKLQNTLEEKIGRSFGLVSDRLEQVYKGLGEMQTLATGVGDLKKVLSNVKTRGILGEIQLGAILEQILAPEQYELNVVTKGNGSERVEFAIKLPGDDRGHIYLPIDSKFPQEPYLKLIEAYEEGIPEKIDSAYKTLERAIKTSAKEIHDKYLEPPYTTDFAIMFLPSEGLYAEVVRHGMVEALQKEYKINIAGPTTMAALLNSLQMGFRTLAIEKRSGEVWNVLGAVKTEFDKFGNVLALAQSRINQANAELDKLVGIRTRNIQRKLSSISSTEHSITTKILEFERLDESDDSEN